MARRSLVVQTNFNSGELSDKILGRSDMERYRNGCKTMTNWIPLIQGGARTTFPSNFLRRFPNNVDIRIEPWESGDNYYLIAFLATGSLHVINPTSGASVFIYGNTPWTGNEIWELDYVQALETMVIVHSEHPPYRLYVDGGVFRLDCLDAQFLAENYGWWTELKVYQQGDVIFVTGTSGENYLFEMTEYVSAPPYYSGATEPDWDSVAAYGDTIEDGSMQWTNIGMPTCIRNAPSEDKIYSWYPGVVTRIGDLVKPQPGDETGYYYKCVAVTKDQMTSILTTTPWPTDPTQKVGDGNVTWQIAGELADVSVWNPTNGYPRTVALYEDRLIFGGNRAYPSRLWFSKISDYFNFDMGQGLDDEGFDVELSSTELEDIYWIFSGRTLLIGTNKGEWAAVQTKALSPVNFEIKKQSSVGSARLKPYSIDGALYHASMDKRQIREVLYNEVENGWTTVSAGVLNPGLLTGVKQLCAASQGSVDSAQRIFIVNDDGTMAIMTRMRDQEVINWCGRTFDGGYIRSVATVNGRIYITFNNDLNTIICVLDEDETFLADMIMEIDTGNPNTTVFHPPTGKDFYHLDYAQITCLVDGMPAVGTYTPHLQTIRTDVAGRVLQVGGAIPTPTLTPMPVAVGATGESIHHLKKRLVRSLIEVVDTVSINVDGKEIPFIDEALDWGAPMRTYTGVKSIRHIGWTREATIVITVSMPYKAEIRGITREVAY